LPPPPPPPGILLLQKSWKSHNGGILSDATARRNSLSFATLFAEKLMFRLQISVALH